MFVSYRKSTKRKSIPSHNQSRTNNALHTSNQANDTNDMNAIKIEETIRTRRDIEHALDKVQEIAVGEQVVQSGVVSSVDPEKESVAESQKRGVTTHPKKKSTSTVTKSSRTKQSASNAQASTSVKNKVHRAQGVLYGLSTLKRQGNVRVNVMDDHTTVRSNFLLGPLKLKVEKAFGRGVKRELKSATATTTEMVGRINLRIVNGAATLHSIKVQQPKQVSS